MGTILGTAGHSTLGSSEKAIPRISIKQIARALELNGRANTISTSVSIAVPIIIIVPPLPMKSYKTPKSGVRIIDANGNIAGITPAILGSTLYFAKGVILVEGISETILIPILAQRMGVDLRKKQISVIPICGVTFEIFKKLFKKDTFDVPVAIVTDADPEIDQSTGWKNAKVVEKGSICDRTKKLQESFAANNEARVYNSKITLEYDLAIDSNDNPLIITKAWEICFKKEPKTLNTDIINECKTLEEKAETIWRVVCLSDNRHGKGDLASNLAELLDEKNEKNEYKYKFTVPTYIKEAISFVNEKLN